MAIADIADAAALASAFKGAEGVFVLVPPNGVISSFLQPLEKPVPMVATADIGRVAAQLLEETWTGRRIVELEGPRGVTPNEINGHAG